jgi:tetratricopeptide (TPR) repeat protein/predicted Ser/Thr protein kinase
MVAGKNDMPDETRSFKMLTPGTVISHYRIVGKIGAGGMGVVYKAEDTKLKRTVALKFLPPRFLCDADARARFEHEAQSASALNHPNITTIYEIDDAEGRCFIAMEHIEGKSIKQAVADGTDSIDEILDMALQIGKGLDAAHRKGVVHRDIKSENIMVNTDGVVKIMDFGLAKLKGVTKLTKEGTTVGTLQYMSPEQVLGKGVDRRSDIFSLGVVLFEMITGRLPFKGDDEAALINSILNETPEPLARYKADVSEGLQRIVDKALAKDKEERYQHADEVVADLKREKRGSGLTETGRMSAATVPREPRKRLLHILVPVAAAGVIAMLIFVLEPFRIEMGPEKEAVAQENSLAIMYFENMVDPEDTDRTAKMATALLITDLSESEYLEVMSRQRLFDILRALDKEDLKVIDESVASEVAERAGVKWILTGNVFQTEPNMILTSDVSDAVSGKVLASQRVTGEPGEDIFAVVDRLSKAIRDDMALPEAIEAEADRSVADVTTHSAEAYRYYTEGFDFFWKHYWNEAEVCFRKSLEYDSTLAMANWALSYIVAEPEESELMARAVRHSDKASDLERDYIAAMAAKHAGDYRRAVEILTNLTERYPNSVQAYLSLGVTYQNSLGDPEKAIPAFRRVLEIDPQSKEAYNQLAYAYDDAGNLDNAIWAINEYIALAPDEANPYDSRGDLYAYNGRIDDALESYRKASEIKPLFSTGAEGAMYLFKRDYARADSCFKRLAMSADRGDRSVGRMYLATVPMYRGRFEEALRILDDGIAADRMEQYFGSAASSKHRLTSLIHLERGDSAAAVEAGRKCMELLAKANPNDPAFATEFYTSILCLAGSLDEAERLAAPRIALYADDPEAVTQDDFTLLGLLEHARGNTDDALAFMEHSITAGDPFLHLRTITAKMYIEAGRLGEAVDLLEAAVIRYDRVRAMTPIWSVKAHYWLGRAYEGSGWNTKAVEQYETFLGIWKDADPGIPVVEDTRRRLEGLKQDTSVVP